MLITKFLYSNKLAERTN